MLERIFGHLIERRELPNMDVISGATFKIQVREDEKRITGTGVHIGNGMVLTAAHVFSDVSGNARKYIVNSQGLYFPNPSITFLGDLDLAVMNVPSIGVHIPAVDVAAPPSEDEPVTMVTHTELTGDPVTKGVVLGALKNLSTLASRFSSVIPREEVEKDGFVFLIDDSDPNPEPVDGTSGSGVYNTNGQLVGIHYASLPVFHVNGRSIYGSAVSASSNFQDLLNAHMRESSQ